MAKYGRGLNIEIVGAVNRGEIKEPFSVADVKKFAISQGWDIPITYLNVSLANGASPDHSKTYKKYFVALGDGMYKVGSIYKGPNWR